MEELIWTEDFSVGVARIDNQHKQLVGILNRLIAESQVSTNSETISEILNDMMTYSHEHFEAEEELLRQHAYPHLKEHITQHHAFRRQVANFCSATMINVVSVPENILDYLSSWLLEHILESDMAYKPFLQERGLE